MYGRVEVPYSVSGKTSLKRQVPLTQSPEGLVMIEGRTHQGRDSSAKTSGPVEAPPRTESLGTGQTVGRGGQGCQSQACEPHPPWRRHQIVFLVWWESLEKSDICTRLLWHVGAAQNAGGWGEEQGRSQ